ncbi:hypothetical protein [Streptosporangium sp. NPDC000396]|uniref:hypothetical protein n=1 Tax=Streptosporangium sp. NPDC000396 TaxID=3366185 RepID=UPI0036A6AD6A
MKRMIAGISAAAAVTLVTATPVQAAPADPVKALKDQFVAGRGVKFTDRTTMIEEDASKPFLRRTGTFQ